MTKGFFIGVVLAMPVLSCAQNLVPNPSFEEYTECPTDISQFDRTIGWESIQGSPDLFNNCSASDTVNVPLNFLGSQQAFEGQGYAGVLTAEFFAKEMIQCQLVTALEIGVPTAISFRVSPGGFGVPGIMSPELASSGMGLRFSVEPLPYFTFWGQYTFNDAVIHMTEVLNDTSSWNELSTLFVPDSNYRYLQIGNFFGDDATQVEVLDPNGDGGYAYAFVDNVCVSQVEGFCEVGSGFAMLGHRLSPTVHVVGGSLVLTLPEGHPALEQIWLSDAIGRSLAVVPAPFTGCAVQISLAANAAGVFLLHYRTVQGLESVVRFILVEP
ncbi:MAG: hypothetical protein JNM62_08865 [Flavobacteriales bacterium]|nr:hypothetical protein [Flavobacteriales bacterium]